MRPVLPPAVRSAEPTRARYPDEEGYADRDGVRLFYEVYEPPGGRLSGTGELTLLLHYPWAINHSRAWKAQIPYLSRHYRVIAFDQRGSGRSDTPRAEGAYRLEEHARDVLAVMDATATERAALVTISIGARAALWLAANHSLRIAGAALIGAFAPLTPWPPEATRRRAFLEPRTNRRMRMAAAATVRNAPHFTSRSVRRFARQVRPLEGARKFSRDYWLQDQRGFLEWFYSKVAIPDRHSTRQIEDAIEWGVSTDPETLARAWTELDIDDRAILRDRAEILDCCARIRCPVVVIHADEDIVSPPEWGAALAEATGGRMVWVERTGHDVRGRKPVAVNLALREFAEELRAREARVG